MMATMLALIDPGDEVVIFQPFYENYGPDALLTGATPKWVTLHPPDWHIDPDELRAAFSPRTKAVILNTPNNPTGKVFTRDELSVIAGLCREFDAYALSDEIYEYIQYTERPHVSIASLPGMADRTVTISGLSKTFSVTGWRLGYCVAPAVVTSGIRKAHDFLTVGAPAPLQEAVADAIEHLDQGFYRQLATTYRARRDLLQGALVEAGFRSVSPEGAYYILADFSALSESVRAGGPPLDDTAFAVWLSREVGVTPVPGSSFFREGGGGRSLVRFVFCKTEDVLQEAARRLRAIGRGDVRRGEEAALRSGLQR
jgi:aminotransferase